MCEKWEKLQAAMEEYAMAMRLGPCPVCKNPAILEKANVGEDEERWWVRCYNRECGASTKVCLTGAEAVEAWNDYDQRTGQSVLDELQAQLEECDPARTWDVKQQIAGQHRTKIYISVKAKYNTWKDSDLIALDGDILDKHEVDYVVAKVIDLAASPFVTIC